MKSKIDRLDEDCLCAAQREGFGAWRPWQGVYARARRLAKAGLLKEAGTAAMPPHVVYVITDAGRKALAASTSQ